MFIPEAKNRFLRWRPSRISKRNDLSYFDLQVTKKASFKSNWPFILGEEATNRFLRCDHGGHLGFPIGNFFLHMFDLQVTPMLPTTFQVSWLFCSGEQAKNTIQRWQP